MLEYLNKAVVAQISIQYNVILELSCLHVYASITNPHLSEKVVKSLKG